MQITHIRQHGGGEGPEGTEPKSDQKRREKKKKRLGWGVAEPFDEIPGQGSHQCQDKRMALAYPSGHQANQGNEKETAHLPYRPAPPRED